MSADPLKTRKDADLFKFRWISALIERKDHLQREGLLQLIDVALSMNAAERLALEELLRAG